MTTINIDKLLYENKRIGRMINDLGDLILRENFNIYNDIVINNLQPIFYNDLNEKNQKEFLIKIYNCMIDKLKEINFYKE